MPLSCNVENFVLLAALPLIDAIRMSYIYTALPLHYTTMGWALWRLSIILSMTNATRLPINILIVWVGEWVILPLSVLMVVAQIPMLLNPASESFIALALKPTPNQLPLGPWSVSVALPLRSSRSKSTSERGGATCVSARAAQSAKFSQWHSRRLNPTAYAPGSRP